MKRPKTMLAIGCSAVFALAACGQGDQGDAADRNATGNARGEAAPGQSTEGTAAGTAADGSAQQSTQPTGVGGNRAGQQSGGGNTTLAMSGTPSSHIVDGAGTAVYILEGNMDGTKCDAACEEAWPPVLAHDVRPNAGPGIEMSRIGTLDRNGRTYVTYGGQPLYRYAGDMGAGRTAGAGVEDQWGKWSLVGLDGQPTQAQTQ